MNNDDALRRKLAAACHVVAREGHSDATLGHLSARIEPDIFLMKPRKMGLEEVGPDDFVTLDLSGQKKAGSREPHGEIPIHSEIYRFRPDVNCIIHTHPPFSIAFAATGQTLKPVSHEACLFWPGVPIFNSITDLLVKKEQGELLAECLGDKRAVFMQSHGIVVAGGSIEEAVVSAICLERAAQIQMMLVPCGNYNYTSDDEARVKKDRIYNPKYFMAQWKYYLRKWGELDAVDL